MRRRQFLRTTQYALFLLLSINLLAACTDNDATPLSATSESVLEAVTAVSTQPSPPSTTATPVIVEPLAYPITEEGNIETAVAYPPPPTLQPVATSSPYPINTPTPNDSLTPSPLPPSPTSPLPATAITNTDTSTANHFTYLPFISNLTEQSASLGITPLNFDQIQAELNAQVQDIVYAKIGFHAGIGYQSENLVEWMRALDAAGVPFFLKSTDNAEPIFIAQELKRRSGVPHTLVYRRVSSDDYNLDVPRYDLPATEAAVLHWQEHMELFPPELDPSLIWIETINEIDRNRSEWLGQFALKTAELAMADGFNWAAFGWSSGEPEPEQWQTPSMLAYLELAGNNPDRLAVAVHEYSYTTEDITDGYPYKIGRFEQIFQIADQNNFPRPTILITEWGWEYVHNPAPDKALKDIAWANQIYAPYPEVKGAAIWYLGGGFKDVALQTEQLIIPVTEYALQNYFTRPLE